MDSRRRGAVVAHDRGGEGRWRGRRALEILPYAPESMYGLASHPERMRSPGCRYIQVAGPFRPDDVSGVSWEKPAVAERQLQRNARISGQSSARAASNSIKMWRVQRLDQIYAKKPANLAVSKSLTLKK